MKLKYYLRGLGMGMIVTALLMGVSVSGEAESIRQDAVLTEETAEKETAETLAERAEKDKEEIETQEIQETQETEATSETKETEVTEENVEAVSAETLDETSQETESAEETVVSIPTAEGAQKSYLLNIVKGDDSGTVARKLQNAGLIENATEFDAFLMQHGYDKKISVGVVEIPLDATWMEIAKRLSGKTE